MALPAERRTEEAAAGVGGCRVPAGQGGLPIGFRFRPTDEELLLHYLRRKALSCPLPADIIPVADLARLHPWDLPGEADGERYFFHLPATGCWRKGGGAGRAGGSGVWRASGKERLVIAPRCGRPIGAKRTLFFCRPGGARTGWAMHEYRLLPAGLAAYATAKSLHTAKDWVVCRVFKKATPAHHGTARGRRRGEADVPAPSSPASSCVTESRSGGGGGGMEEDDDETASNSPRPED